MEAVQQWLALCIKVDEGLVDPKRLNEFITQNGSFTFRGFLEEGTTFHSVDEFLEFRAAWMEPYDDWSYEAEKFLEAGENQVLVLFRQRGKPRGSDSWVEQHYGIVYTIEEGLLSGAEIYADPGKALEAAGLSE